MRWGPGHVVGAGLVVGVIGIGTAMAAPRAAVRPADGEYASSIRANEGLTDGIVFTVNRGRVSDVYVTCHRGSTETGLETPPGTSFGISGAAFHYRGKAALLDRGAVKGDETLTISGRFSSSTHATGTTAYTLKSPLQGCPGRRFSVTELP